MKAKEKHISLPLFGERFYSLQQKPTAIPSKIVPFTKLATPVPPAQLKRGCISPSPGLIPEDFTHITDREIRTVQCSSTSYQLHCTRTHPIVEMYEPENWSSLYRSSMQLLPTPANAAQGWSKTASQRCRAFYSTLRSIGPSFLK